MAYDIADMFGASVISKRLAKDPYYRVLKMAGDLELPEEVAGLWGRCQRGP